MINTVIASSVLIMAVLVIRFLVHDKISPILQYALWLPVALRLMMPIPLWNSGISILNFLPESLIWEESAAGNPAADDSGDSAKNAADTYLVGGENLLPDNFSEDGYGGAASAQDSTTYVNLAQDSAADESGTARSADSSTILLWLRKEAAFHKILTCVWIAGVVCVGGYMLFYQIKWKRYLGKNARPLKGKEKYQDKLSVYTVPGLPSPCLSGRKIYLTKEMASDKRRLEHILMHEYCHYRHFDFVWVVVRCVLTAVYWFHPLVWAAAYLSKQDGELACDEAALKKLGEKERIAYGKTLLCLIVKEPCGRNRIGMVSTMSGKEKGIRERILRIAKRRRYIAAVSGIVILLAAGLVAVTFSGKEREAGEENNVNKADETGEENNAYQADAADKEALQDLEEEVQEELKRLGVALQDEVALYADKQDSEAVLRRLARYDARISIVDSHEEIPDAKNPADYIQAYYSGEISAVDEDIYLLEDKKASDGSNIKIYGMYTNDYGYRGVKFLIDGDVDDFDIPWNLPGHGREDNIAVYEYAEDGLPRSFAVKMAAVNNARSEVWNLYLCDRYDTGTIELYTPDTEELIKQIQERISFKIIPDECRIDVYDNEKKIGSIEVPASASAMEKIDEAVCDGSAAGYLLGTKEEEIRLITAVGLKIKETDEIWYQGLNFLSFPIECGSFGERKLGIGEATIDTEYKNGMKQSAESFEAWVEAFQGTEAHHDVMIQYQNPCPDATRISDAFGERIHPVTQEKITHNGIDLAAPKGSDVLAAADGIVIQTGFDNTSGNYIVLYHELSGEYTYYASCQEILVSEGETVNAGDKIATVGSSGRSTGAHLHFALSQDGEYIEPVFEGIDVYKVVF